MDRRRLGWLLVALLPLGGVMSAAPAPAADFEKNVAPILIKHCISCHNPSELTGGLDLTRHAGASRGGAGGPVISSDKPDASALVKRVSAGTMPPKKTGDRLSAEEVAALRAWVADGAHWPGDRVLSAFELTTDRRAGYDWWALQPVKRLNPPKPGPLGAGLGNDEGAGLGQNPIDAFVHARLTAAGKTLSAEAGRRTLIRRATFDLIGLPPTPEEIEAFVSDAAAQAYEKLIDRLLASPHHGERWGRHWLDVVRFGESDGFENDKLRDHAWHYRDYVIRSLNADKPYDLFVKEQLAGDVLEPLTQDGLLATGFLVAGPWDEIQNVAASKIEKARAHEEQLEELIAAVGQTFLGLTVNCARCHDHKFDPILQADYYRLKAVFDGVDHGNRSSLLPAQERERVARLQPLQVRLKELRAELARLAPEVTRELPAEALVEGRFGKALDARRAHVVLPAGPDLQTPPFTVECWAKLFSKGSFNILVANNLKESANHWEIYSYAGSGEFAAYLPGFAPAEIKSGVDITDGRWHHLALTFDGQRVRLLIDAKLAKEQALVRQRTDEKLGQLYIGAYPPQKLGCDGLVDEVRVSQGIRSIDQLPHEPFVKDGPTLGLWHLDDRRIVDVGAPSRDTIGDGTSARGANTTRSLEAVQADIARLETEFAWQAAPQAYTGVRRQPGPTHVLQRGDLHKPGALVTAGSLSAVRPPVPGFSLPGDALEAQRRLRFAEWVVAPENPLTARVLVNRLWHYHFGQGLVETPSDLGFNGGRPAYPELLDWLAAEFSANGWSVKHMHRLIMTSATYRQSASGQKGRRLEAEIVRDAMLAVSGELHREMSGPSFRPFTITVRNHNFYHLVDKGTPEFNRRTVYRINVNTGKSPFLDALDCPAPSLTTPQRRTTVTPLQALALMNDTFVQRQAEMFAERVRREAGSELTGQIQLAYGLAFGRSPSDVEQAAAGQLAGAHGMTHLCWVLLNTSEFLYTR